MPLRPCKPALRSFRAQVSHTSPTAGPAVFAGQQLLCVPANRPFGLFGHAHGMLLRQQALRCLRGRNAFASRIFAAQTPVRCRLPVCSPIANVQPERQFAADFQPKPQFAANVQPKRQFAADCRLHFKSLNEHPLEGKSGASSRGNSSSNSVY